MGYLNNAAAEKGIFMQLWGRSKRSILASAVTVAILFICLTTHAASSVVKDIEFKGNRRTPTETLREAIHTRVGSYFNVDVINLDIKKLYKLGQFQDVRVESESVRGGVKITYILVERPLISKISFEGNRKLKNDDLASEVVQRSFGVLDERAVAESMENIRNAYAKKGYYLADIDYHVETTAGDEAELVFDIHENQGVSVRRIMFIGNKVFSDKELRGVVKTRQKGALSFLTNSGKFDEEQLRLDLMLLTYHYLNHGYVKVKVAPPKVTISKDKRYIFITFQLHEGKQYRIGDVTIDGDILTTHEELVGMLKLKQNDIYSQMTLDQDIQALTDLYGDEGYAYTNVVPQVIPDDETLTADIHINISKGKRIRIEKINIFGNTTTRDKVIRREMELMENDRYSERLMRKSKEKLMRLGYFEEVNFATPRGKRDDTMIINVTVKERSTRTFNIGAGFSSAEKFIFNASIRMENMFGYGVSSSFSAELSKIRQMFMISMSDPYFLDTQWLAGFSAYRSAYNYGDFNREATGGEINFGHRIFDYFSAFLGYQIEQVKVSNFNFVVPQRFRQNSSGLTSALSLTLNRDTRDNRLLPTRGLYNSLTQEVSGAKIGGENNFYRANFRTMFYKPIWKDFIFKQFLRIGYIRSLDSNPVPLFERFFLGGPNSLRGYYPNSIGPRIRIPRTPSGREEFFVYGGDKLLLFVTEFEIPIYAKAGIKAVAFFDAGNTFSENENYSFDNLRLDYGFGIRWHSPMGPLRFEWGIPINKRAGDDAVVFNFTIGNFF